MELSENMEVAYESAVKMILQWDASEARLIFNGDRVEINEYLQAIAIVHRWMELNTKSEDQSKAYKVIGVAMARLEEEFVNILTGHASPRYSTCSSSLTDSTIYEFHEDDYLDYDSPSEQEINDLRSIAIRMNSVGYLHQCIQLYKRVRKAILDVRFQRLGVEKLSIKGVQRLEWEVLEVMIRQWIRAAKVCVRILFANEKQLCEQIFEGLGTVVDFCFMETVKDTTIQLFDFVEAVSTSRRSPERLFKLSDLHTALSDISPDVDVLFQSKSGDPIKIEAVEVPIGVWAADILSRLAEAVRGILSQLENDVLHESTTILVPKGTVHSLTRYVTGYIIRMCDYKQALTEIIVSKPSLTDLRYSDDETIPDMDFMELEEQTPLALHLIWIIVILLFKLEDKSKHYKDATLAQVFMINNVHYIVQKIIHCPELRRMIGFDFLKKLIIKIRMVVTSFERATWGRILSCLIYESYSPPVIVIKERLKTFNTLFKVVCKTQVTWLIPDIELREDLRLSISVKLIHAYRTFLARYCSRLEYARHHIKYSPEELETAVLGFFEGIPESQLLCNRSRTTSSHSSLRPE